MSHSPEVIVVGALATKVDNIAPFRYTAEAIADDASAIHYVHGGVANHENGFTVATISQQEEQITEIIESAPSQRFIILSQSMGALAALNCLEKFSREQVNSIAVAPPLLKPSEIIRSERIMTRSKNVNGHLYLPSYSFALGDSGPGPKADNPLELLVPDEVFSEVDDVSPDYWRRTYSAVEDNRLRVVMPTEDWNESALEASRNLSSVAYLPGPHSLITDQATLERNIGAMAHIAQQFDRSSLR